jgi:hypothetical protein
MPTRLRMILQAASLLLPVHSGFLALVQVGS